MPFQVLDSVIMTAILLQSVFSFLCYILIFAYASGTIFENNLVAAGSQFLKDSHKDTTFFLSYFSSLIKRKVNSPPFKMF